MLGTMWAYRVFKDSRGWALNTNLQTITILRKVLDIKVTTLTLLIRKITFFLRKDFIVRFWEKSFSLLHGKSVLRKYFIFENPFFENMYFLNKAFFENIFLCIGKHFRKNFIFENTSLKKIWKNLFYYF